MVLKKLKKSLIRVRVIAWTYSKWLRWRARRKFQRDFKRFSGLSGAAEKRFSLDWKDRFPCIGDDTSSTTIDRHYLYHPAWAARILAKTRPSEHVDISSYIYFSTLVSAFLPVRFYDYRPVALALDNLESGFANLVELPFVSGSIKSLSCMHVVEHIGLGRYGDALDPDGDIKAISELRRVLAPGGQLLFVVPIGQPKIEYNAHRIYGYDQIIDYFDGLILEEYALIPDSAEQGGLIRGASASLSYEQKYGCGCFLFRRPDEQVARVGSESV